MASRDTSPNRAAKGKTFWRHRTTVRTSCGVTAFRVSGDDWPSRVTWVVESTDRALKVDALVTQIDGTQGALARVQGQWGDEFGRAQSAAGTQQRFSAYGLELKPTPVPPRDSAWASHLTFSPPARGVHTSLGWERENVSGSNSRPVSHSVQSVSRILRWVFNRACVLEPVWRQES